MKKIIVVLTLITLTVAISLSMLWITTKPRRLDKKATGNYQTPTLFVHGYGGNYGSEKNMIADLSQHAGFRQVLRYNIDSKGKLSVSGHWQPDVKHPLIAVVFKDGKPNAKDLSTVLIQLKNNYKIQTFNAVGHSAGANAWVNWTVSADKENRPELQRLITIAGPFNGFMGMSEKTDETSSQLNDDGKPNMMVDSYKYLADNKAHFPKTTRVLNLFGNTGKESDGVVPVNSARALSYIVETNAKSYTEHEITNNKAQHSQLHKHNQVVNHYLYDFLTAD
ncbi:alpha/beta hydrolase [Bacilli bacterium]|nr:alpha/beta hydrolase [Bacilli bacterium]GHU42725.1 alpha/beta hydrolase [Bacilli bacterium]